GKLEFQCSIDSPLPTVLKREEIQQRRATELARIREEMREFVVSGQFQRREPAQGVIAPHFKIMCPLGSRVEPAWIIRLCGRVLRVQPSKRYLLDIRRCKKSPVVCVEDIGLIMLVGGADPGTDLSFIIESLNRITPHTEVERPVIVRCPLILDPEFLPRLDILIGR